MPTSPTPEVREALARLVWTASIEASPRPSFYPVWEDLGPDSRTATYAIADALIAAFPSLAAPKGWRPSITEPPPQDGSEFWAYLYQTGVRKLRWLSPAERAQAWGPNEDPADFDGLYVEAADLDEEWEPAWWLPLDALPPPPEQKEG